MADDILSNAEIDNIIESFVASSLEDIGSLSWFNARDKLYKLYQVAVFEGSKENCQERITTAVHNHSKIEAFVKELLTVSVWKEKVLPEILTLTPQPEQAFPIYIILYSEVLLVGLIQTFLYHGRLYCDLGDLCLDLIDYAVAQITTLDPKDSFNSYLREKKNGRAKADDSFCEILEQKAIMSFDIGTTCITIIRFIAENFESLPLNVASRIYNTHDIPVLVGHLLEKGTWSLKDEDRTYKYEQSRWKEWRIDEPQLSNTECQVWLLMRELLLNNTCGTVYYFSNYRKDHLCKLIRFLHDATVDQLSPLADLKLWLHRLSISSDQGEHTYNSLILDVSTQFRERLYKDNEGKWASLAQKKARLLLYPQRDEVVKMAKGFASGLDGIEKICEDINRCMVCFERASQRCSKCKTSWYCSRKCQVNHWPIHKRVCST